jgi:mannose-1-phosphate guanylyltransferase
MLRLIADDSLFQVAVKRLEELFPVERICVVTVKEQAELLEDQCPGLPPDNFMLEPMPRGTASVVGLAAVALKHRHPQAVMAILTADHFIADVERFRSLLRSAYDVAQEGYLVTLGITPTYPATGYGYIQSGAPLGVYGGAQAFQMLRFIEKPNEAQAQSMLQSGDYAWNSGMFIWRVDRILAEFARQMPVLYAQLEQIDQAWDTPERQKVIASIWPGLQEETIDYGIMEHAQDVAVIPATGLGWSDVGSWESLFDVLPADEDGNIIMGGRHIAMNTRSSLVYMDQEHRLIVTLGVQDLIVVDTGDVLLVCHKDQAQKVRQVVNQLKQTNQDYL